MVMSKMVILYIVMPFKLFAISKLVFDISVSGLGPELWHSCRTTHTLAGGWEPGDSNQEQSDFEQVFWAIIFWASIIKSEEGGEGGG